MSFILLRVMNKLRRISFGLLPLIFALGLMVAFAFLRSPNWQQSFASDLSPAAWLSSAQLLGAALLAVRLSIDRLLPQYLGALLAIALWLLALDEQFMLHEQWKYGCQAWLKACSYLWVRELPIILVALLGTVFLRKLWQLKIDIEFRFLVAASLAVGLFAIYIDLFEVNETLAVLEEAFEVMAEALFLGSLLIFRP
jgi:hypothetical protein